MRQFEFYIEKKDVLPRQKDEALAKALLKDTHERFAFAEKQELNLATAKYVLENAYEALREAIDARMALDGLKSYSHEATIAYLQKFKQFNSAELNTLDILRRKRNGIKYYGETVDTDDAEQALIFSKKILPRIIELSKKN